MATVNVQVTVDGCCCHLPEPPRQRMVWAWHIGAPTETTEEDRVAGPPAPKYTGKVDLIMDLQADKKVSLSLGWTDEADNPVPAPAGTTVVYTVDDPSIIALTDNGDGTAVAASTGVLGNAVVHAEITADLGSGPQVLTGDLAITVVAGDAERVAIVAGEPEEITPDA